MSWANLATSRFHSFDLVYILHLWHRLSTFASVFYTLRARLLRRTGTRAAKAAWVAPRNDGGITARLGPRRRRGCDRSQMKIRRRVKRALPGRLPPGSPNDEWDAYR